MHPKYLGAHSKGVSRRPEEHQHQTGINCTLTRLQARSCAMLSTAAYNISLPASCHRNCPAQLLQHSRRPLYGRLTTYALWRKRARMLLMMFSKMFAEDRLQHKYSICRGICLLRTSAGIKSCRVKCSSSDERLPATAWQRPPTLRHARLSSSTSRCELLHQGHGVIPVDSPGREPWTVSQ